MKKHEQYKESQERFKNQQETVGFMNWEVFHDNFKLECWNMKDHKGQVEPVIIQLWKDGAGYCIYKQVN